MTNGSLEGLTENVWTRLIARGAMIVTPLIVTAFGFLMFGYLDTRFREQATSIAAVVVRVDRIETVAGAAATKTEGIDTRTAVVENNQVVGRQTQEQISSKLDMISNSIADLREKTAGISATVEAIKSRREGP